MLWRISVTIIRQRRAISIEKFKKKHIYNVCFFYSTIEAEIRVFQYIQEVPCAFLCLSNHFWVFIKVYLVGIVPMCLPTFILYEHMYDLLSYDIWTHVRPPCYINTCTTSLLFYEHMYDFLVVIWTHVRLPSYMNSMNRCLLLIWTHVWLVGPWPGNPKPWPYLVQYCTEDSLVFAGTTSTSSATESTTLHKCKDELANCDELLIYINACDIHIFGEQCRQVILKNMPIFPIKKAKGLDWNHFNMLDLWTL